MRLQRFSHRGFVGTKTSNYAGSDDYNCLKQAFSPIHSYVSTPQNTTMGRE